MDGAFRLLFIGDIIGPTGRAAIQRFVPALRSDLRLDAVIANGENSADNGFGITIPIAESLLGVVDFLTLGDHAFDQPEIGSFLDSDARIIRPYNFEGEKPGRGSGMFRVGEVTIGVANLLGKLFMRPAVQPPYTAADHVVQELQAANPNCIIVDMQAEATSEKMGMGWFLDGRVTAVLGTHTHVATADLRILPGGTAFVSDVGMTGGRDSIIGFERTRFLDLMAGTASSGPPSPAGEPARLDAVLIEIDVASGKAVSVERIVREG
jgi:2',3'-cyclic-nucleotide 2'-phosphodiesterase